MPLVCLELLPSGGRGGVRPCWLGRGSARAISATPVLLAGVAGTRSPELNVAILYQHDHGKPGFLPQEAGICINLDIGLNVAGPPK